MIYYRMNKGIKVGEVWFSIPDVIDKECKVLNFHCLARPIKAEQGDYLVQRRDTGTLVTDLSKTPEELLAGCGKDTRKKIKRADREGVVCKHYSPEEIMHNEALIDNFQKAYHNMHIQKGIDVKSEIPYIKELLNEGLLYMSVAQMDGEDSVYHVDFVADQIVRNLFSVSKYRDHDSSAEKNAVGRANRFLQYTDMLYFKNLGCIIQDWGGYSSDENLKGINEFKSGFGGEYQKRYYGKVIRSLPLCIAYRMLWRK